MLQVPVLHRGHDYALGGLLARFLSPRLYSNPLISGFLALLDRQYVGLTDSAKRLQFYYNFTIDKNDRSLNL